MRKIFSLLSVFIFTFIFVTGFSSPASAAVKSSSYTQTLKYGNYSISNDYDAATSWVGYAPMNTTTEFTVNQYGVTLTDITQRMKYAWPYIIWVNNKPKIVTKASHGSNETAKAYADFTAKYLKVPLLKGSLTTYDYRFQTYITVTKIDKNKKTVTVKITKTVN